MNSQCALHSRGPRGDSTLARRARARRRRAESTAATGEARLRPCGRDVNQAQPLRPVMSGACDMCTSGASACAPGARVAQTRSADIVILCFEHNFILKTTNVLCEMFAPERAAWPPGCAGSACCVPMAQEKHRRASKSLPGRIPFMVQIAPVWSKCSPGPNLGEMLDGTRPLNFTPIPPRCG